MRRNIISLFTEPKSWLAKGNLEFTELLLMCHCQREFAEGEIQKRYTATQADYKSTRVAQVVLIGIMSQLTAALVLSLAFHVVVAICAIATLLIVAATGFLKTKKRSEILLENMNGCYAWLFYEVLHPVDYEIPSEIIAAFEKFCESNRKQPVVEERKFRQMITGFGYTITTIEN
jgi:hypothetical protein